jgi:hypothetical protein
MTESLEGLLAAEYQVEQWHLLHINVWKAPAIVCVFILTAFAHTGLMGRAFPESLRQWWSRLGAWMLIYSVTWVGLFGMAIYGPILLALAGRWVFAAVTASWMGATGAGVVIGRQTAEAETGGSGTCRISTLETATSGLPRNAWRSTCRFRAHRPI